MDSINLFHLKYFVDAAQEGGVSHSARKNFVSQSAVSRAISSLEQSLGAELVIHRKNHFQLTEAGEAVLEKSRAIFETVADLKNVASDHIKTLRGPLRFGCNQAIASRLIAPALSQLEKKYPGIELTMRLGNTDQIQSLIEKREVDFGIVVDDGEVESHFETKKIYSDHLVVVKSPKFKNDPLKHLIVSRVQKGGFSQKYFREYQKAYGEAITPKWVVASWQVIMDIAIAGYGSALVPRFLCEDALQAGALTLVNHKVRPIPFHLCTITSRNKALPKNARALLEYFFGLAEA